MVISAGAGDGSDILDSNLEHLKDALLAYFLRKYLKPGQSITVNLNGLVDETEIWITEEEPFGSGVFDVQWESTYIGGNEDFLEGNAR